MKINKKQIILGLVVMAIILVFLYFIFYKKAENSTEQLVASDDLHDAIMNYNLLTDYNQKLAVWHELMKACPYWQAFVSDTYDRYKDLKMNKGMTLEDRYFYVARELMEGNGDILEKYSKCGQSYTRAKGNAEYNSVGIKSM